MKLIFENWNKYLFEFGKQSYGSRDQPCDRENPSREMTYGDHLFHPYKVGQYEKNSWECNTVIEDQLLSALQLYISSNDTNDIKGRVGEFILSKLKNTTDKSQPIYRINEMIPVYRGIYLPLDDYGISFIENLPIEEAHVEKINGESYISYPAYKNLTYKMRRQFESFSYSKREAEDFSKRGRSKYPLHVVFETFADNTTAGGGFFLSFKNFYHLRGNPNEPLRSKWNRSQFDYVGRFALEEETLLIGAAPGDELPIVMVNLRLTNLLKLLPKLEQSDPDNPVTIKLRQIIEYVREHAREYGPRGFKPGKQAVFENWRKFKSLQLKPR